ncbi:flippase-like domain-containing protein [Ferroglobus sp.]|uniref:flippase-like domain-containing protein n=1 Tax=Ferroglobus sp. TaxID=2614230 RepID=UPI0025B7FAE4|nr:flippase-like domain-containing protein [Ferroglobus sp.]
MGSSKKELRRTLIAAILSLAVIFAIFKITGENLSTLVEANPVYISIAIIFHVFFWIFWALRLKFLVETFNGNVSFSNSFKITMSSMFFAAITPSSAGGEPVRAYLLSKNGLGIGRATAIILIERLLDSIFFVTSLAILLSLTEFSLKLGFRVGLAFFILLILFLILLRELFKHPARIEKALNFLERRLSKKIYEKIEREVWNFREALVDVLRVSKKRIAVMFALTSILWLSEFLVPSFVLMAFGKDPNFLLSVTSQAIIVVISLLPLTPGSSGISEGSFFYLYSQFVRGSLASVVAGWRIITYLTNMLVGLIFSLKIKIND